MKISKAVKWMFLFIICNLSAQNKYSIDFGVNTQPTETIKINDLNFGIDYSKIVHSNLKIANELTLNSKEINYFNTHVLNSLSKYNQMSNKFTFSYLKSEKTQFNFEIEPFVASENNLKWIDIDWLGGFNFDYKWNNNSSINLGVNRNVVFGKPMILPVFTYNYQYSEKINFSIGFPETKIKYSNNARNAFYIKNIFNGSVYNLDEASKTFSSNSTKSSFSQQTTSFEYERNMEGNWFVNLKAGYDFNRNYLLLDNDYNTTSDFNMKDGFNLGITIKYKH